GTILGKKLTSSGFDLFHALNGEQAINYLKNNKPDLVAVDLLLPGMSGFDILAAIKADSTLEKVPKMVLSNLSKTADIDKAKSLGANKFLVKASTSLDQIVAEIRDMAR
ncbi:MAG: response regulator, partial [Candidatus Paceibacterota bacterium]